MPSRQARIQEDTVFRVLRILEDQPDLSQRALAEQLGISLGGLNYCLRGLIEKGLIQPAALASGRHLHKQAYLITPAGLAHRIALMVRVLQRKQREFADLELEIQALTQEVQTYAPGLSATEEGGHSTGLNLTLSSI